MVSIFVVFVRMDESIFNRQMVSICIHVWPRCNDYRSIRFHCTMTKRQFSLERRTKRWSISIELPSMIQMKYFNVYMLIYVYFSWHKQLCIWSYIYARITILWIADVLPIWCSIAFYNSMRYPNFPNRREIL